MKKLVLCATQRCGSTMIVEDMRNTGVLGCPEEWFLRWNRSAAGADWNTELSDVFRRATGANGVMAVKVMINQVFAVETRLDGLVETKREGIFPRFRELFADAAWVWLIRRDVVSQAISRLIAEQTKVYHATGAKDDAHFAGSTMKGYDPTYSDIAEYRFDAILRNVNAIGIENLAWEHFFETHGIEPLKLVYEQLSRDENMGHLDLLAGLVGLAERPERKQRKMVKLANARSGRWRDRFFEDAARRRFVF